LFFLLGFAQLNWQQILFYQEWIVEFEFSLFEKC
jgi:hypothetical protein